MKAILLLFVILLAWNAIPAKAQGLTEKMQLITLDTLADDPPSTPITAVVNYDHIPTAIDFESLSAVGLEYQPYDQLPMVSVTGLPATINETLNLPGVTSVWYNSSIVSQGNVSRTIIGATAVVNSLNITGKGIGVAIVDTGIDGNHPDLPYGSVVQENIKIIARGHAVTMSSGQTVTELLSGHGTYCAGIVAGRGTASAGKYTGVAPGATIIGLGVGDGGSIVSVLAAFNWILKNHREHNIRVVSNSWGTTGSYSLEHPVNIATKALSDAGIAVVFSAGNAGPATNTINPYAAAPWVIGVAAADTDGTTLAGFSSKGSPGNGLRPTITAPGVFVTSCKSSLGLATNSLGASYPLARCPTPAFPSYICNVGTSVAAAHVSGTLALMLEANPSLTPAQLKTLLTQAATPMPNYQQHEVGAGFLNALDAVELAQAH